MTLVCDCLGFKHWGGAVSAAADVSVGNVDFLCELLGVVAATCCIAPHGAAVRAQRPGMQRGPACQAIAALCACPGHTAVQLQGPFCDMGAISSRHPQGRNRALKQRVVRTAARHCLRLSLHPSHAPPLGPRAHPTRLAPPEKRSPHPPPASAPRRLPPACSRWRH